MRALTRSALFVTGLVCLLGVGTTMAASLPSTGLGQSWPNTTDVSGSPHFLVKGECDNPAQCSIQRP
jgi:hypothetical protein